MIGVWVDSYKRSQRIDAKLEGIDARRVTAIHSTLRYYFYGIHVETKSNYVGAESRSSLISYVSLLIMV
jgi:hypothetical protein